MVTVNQEQELTNIIAELDELFISVQMTKPFCFDDTYQFLSPPPLIFVFGHGIEKRSSRGHLLENLESSSTKIMRRPIIRE